VTFRKYLKAVVYDEVHYSLEWGVTKQCSKRPKTESNPFRKLYSSVASRSLQLQQTPILLCTATATPQDRGRIISLFGFDSRQIETITEGVDRPNLTYILEPAKHSIVERFQELLRVKAVTSNIEALSEPSPTIVYLPSRNDTTSLWFQAGQKWPSIRSDRNKPSICSTFHAVMDNEDKMITIDRFAAQELQVLLSTCALGAGINLSVDTIVILGCITPTDYVQLSGRGGRNSQSAVSIYLYPTEKGSYRAPGSQYTAEEIEAMSVLTSSGLCVRLLLEFYFKLA
jgi:ATP-dependent DNA helicase RecQ